MLLDTIDRRPDPGRRLEVQKYSPEEVLAIVMGDTRERLESIIEQSRELGVDAGWSEAPISPALRDSPDSVLNIWRELNGVQAKFEYHLGKIASGLSKDDYNSAVRDIRDEQLFKYTGAMPWHDARGSAAALLTIATANDDYEKMGAFVGPSVLDETIDGRPLYDYMVRNGVNFKGKTQQEAEAYAREKIEKMLTFLESPITPEFREVIKNCVDSLGIMHRKSAVEESLDDAIKDFREKKLGDSVHIVSVGCGTSYPIASKIKQWIDEGVGVKVTLIDQDPIALAFARQVMRKAGVPDDSIHVVCKPLFGKPPFYKPLNIEECIGGKADIVEDSGLREYLPDRLYVRLAQRINEALREGGYSITANMNVDRPQVDFLDGAMGWQPKVRKRKITDCVRLMEKAGINPQDIRVRVTPEGLYSVYSTIKH